MGTAAAAAAAGAAGLVAPGDDLDLFFHCWVRPHCEACLAPSAYPCSWCATSQTCVPNTVFPYPFGILAPIKSADLCPLAWRERWELRARPFSCRCSSMTVVSVVVAVLTTLWVLLLIWILVSFGRWAGRRWRTRKQRERGVRWIPRYLRSRSNNQDHHSEQSPVPANYDDERAPLLGAA